jgi:hypothetical protein
MSNNISVGQIVWDIRNPSVNGKVIKITQDTVVLVNGDELEITKLTTDYNLVISKLLKKIEMQEETIEELKENYWKVHQQLLKK